MTRRSVEGLRLLCLIGILSLVACGTLPRRPAPPAAAEPVAPKGFPATVRFVGSDTRRVRGREVPTRQRIRAARGDGPLNILALSGGGAGGAFGAGALVGLGQRGERPTFTVVTGVSTGGLLAPFAFLGPAWDSQLVEAFASGRSEQLLRTRSIGVLFRPAIYQGRPLADLVDHFVTNELINAVAEESAKGRVLLVATTDLDKGETVIWDMGVIASHGGEGARTLFRDVLVASTSIPGLFPPVLIHVEGAGKSYDEMHADGSTSVPFFFAPEVLPFMPFAYEELKGANLYVIINGPLGATAQTTHGNAVSILERSFATALDHASRTTLGLSEALSQRYGMTFRFSYIPLDYPFRGVLDFRKQPMQALYRYAAGCAAGGQLWTTPEQAMSRDVEAVLPSSGRTVNCPSGNASQRRVQSH